jgi:hypothetical protein
MLLEEKSPSPKLVDKNGKTTPNYICCTAAGIRRGDIISADGIVIEVQSSKTCERT